MALPSVSLNTPSDSVFNTEFPSLDLTGTESDSNDLHYKVLTMSSTYQRVNGIIHETSNDASRVVFFNGIFVLSAPSSTQLRHFIFTSHDGVNWTRNMDIAGQSYVGRVDSFEEYNGILYMRIGGTLHASTDGFHWTRLSINRVNAIAYGNGMYVATRDLPTSVDYFTSVDGMTWTSRPMPEGKTMFLVVFVNGHFYSLGNRQAMTSIDGINWVSAPDLPFSVSSSYSAFSLNDIIFVSTSLTYRSKFQMSTDGGLTFQTLFESGGVNSTLGSMSPVGDGAIALWLPGYIFLYYPPYRHTRDHFSSNLTSIDIRTGSYGSNYPNASVAIGNGMMVVLPGLANHNHVYVKKYRSYSSDADPGFNNLSNPADTAPFNAGDQIRYTFQNNLESGQYVWYGRAIAPDGDNIYSNWTPPNNFSIVRPPNPGIFMQFLT